jgi:outer membrane protein with beta-barrel domain
MRRALPLLALALALVLVPRSAGAFGIGIGAYGGSSSPISQDDVKTGGTYGVRLPISIIPLVSVEPYWGESKLGDGETTVGGVTTSVDGFDVSSFGVNAMLGSLLGAPGIKFYPYVGIASSKFSRSGSADITKTSYNFGLGGALGLSKLTLHGRAEGNVVDTGDKTREFVNLTLGLSYDLFKKL